MKKNIKKLDFIKIAKMYRIFSNPKRLEIVFLLTKKEMSFISLLKILKIRKANLSQHLTLLSKMNFIEKRNEGRNLYCFIKNKKIIKMINLFKELWKKEKVKC